MPDIRFLTRTDIINGEVEDEVKHPRREPVECNVLSVPQEAQVTLRVEHKRVHRDG